MSAAPDPRAGTRDSLDGTRDSLAGTRDSLAGTHGPHAGGRGLLAAAVDLFLGARCHGCAAPGWGLCPNCSAEIDGWVPRWVRPDPCPAGYPPTVAGGPYAGLASALITAHKDRQALSLRTVLGSVLAESLGLLLADVPRADRVVLVPAPSSSRANRERGLDAGHAIARSAAHRLRHQREVVVRSWLRQRGTVRDQSGLDHQERAQNLSGALRTTGSARPRRDDVLVVVDDVTTTGATLAEAVRALKDDAGIEVLGAATVAATTRWRRPVTRPGTRPGTGFRRLRTE